MIITGVVLVMATQTGAALPQQADRAPTAQFPRPQKTHKQVRQEYDRFSDTTLVTVTLSHNTGILKSLFSTTTVIDLGAIFEGRVPAASPEPIIARFRLSNVRTLVDLAADSQTQPRADSSPEVAEPGVVARTESRTPMQVVFLVDESDRVGLPLTPLGRRVTPLDDENPERAKTFAIQDSYAAQLPIATLLRLASAQRKVEGRLRKVVFKIEKDQLDALRDFASRLAPAEPISR